MVKKKIKGTIDDYPLVQITCFDWISDSSWMSVTKGKRLEPSKCHSVGKIFNKTKTKIQTFSSWSYEDGELEIGTIETIPRAWVIKIKAIKL
jgi:hypothetical protein